MGVRYHDPITARFLTRDPVGPNVNDYTYCENNPVGWVDPSGLDYCRPWLPGPYWTTPRPGWVYVDPPGFWESLIPVWGSTRQADYCFQTGHPVRGFGNMALAVSDVFGVKAVLTVLGKVGVKSAVKTGVSAGGRALAKPLANKSGRILISRGGEEIALKFGKHALDRMARRKISQEAVKLAVSRGKQFKYFHEGVWKTGYYLAQKKVFVGTYAGEIRTVMDEIGRDYITRLLRSHP